MKKKLIIIILLIIFLLIVGFIIIEKQYDDHHISLGNSNFEIPDNFYEGVSNKQDRINLTNGENSILLARYDQGTLDEQITGLEKYMYNEANASYKVINYTIFDTKIYKLTVLNWTENYYWFEKNNDVYYIYNWDGLENMDQIVSDFVKNMSP